MSFDATKVSLRLIMFHVFFLKQFSPRKGKSIKEIAEFYDQRNGLAPDELRVEFQKEIFRIQKVDSYM